MAVPALGFAARSGAFSAARRNVCRSHRARGARRLRRIRRNLGAGGIVTHLAAADEIADAAERLLLDHTLRRRMGETLRARVSTYYTSERAAGAYHDLYTRLTNERGAQRLTGAA